jgi:ribonuclease-3
MTDEEIKAAEEAIGYTFRDRGLLALALTHSSLVDSRLLSNERMEFLGDAVLGLVVCEHLYSKYEGLLEGEMTKIKSTVVSRHTCAHVAREMGLGDLLRLGKGMTSRDGRPHSVVAAVFEAIIGAVYLDGGFEVAREFIVKHLGHRIEKAARSGHQSNFKSVLQQAAQQMLNLTPQYVVLDEKGPDHAKCFEVCVEIGARRFESTWGPSKKEAEQLAALQALVELELAERTPAGDVRLLTTDGVA